MSFLLALLLAVQADPVRTGLEALRRDGFAPLRGKRVGLVTNHSAVDASGRSSIDILAAGKGFRLTALFSPEHGIRGKEDRKVDSSRDEKTGLPIHSLYGKTRRPTAEMLAGVDVLVFDIQDIGARYYTYITTMAFVMEAAKEHGKRVVVLDRPNPIGGAQVEGPILEKELTGKFIGYFPLPTRHGMTVGELAGLFNRDFGIGCRLEVVRVEGWKRAAYLDETPLPWINPSPNMTSLRAAIAYPGIGALEGTNLSVGRGTEKPFLWYGAPWIDGAKLCRTLNARGLKGVRFQEAVFTPRKIPGRPVYPYTDQACRGFEVDITDRRAFRPVRASIHILDALYRLHPEKLTFGRSCGMIGLRSIEADLKSGKAPAEIEDAWRPALDAFRKVRAARLLYE